MGSRSHTDTRRAARSASFTETAVAAAGARPASRQSLSRSRDARATAGHVRATVGLLAALAVGVGLLPAHAGAQTDKPSLTEGGYDLHLFRHAVDSKGLLTVNGADVLAHKDYSFGLVLDGAFNLLPYSGFENDNYSSGSDPDATSEDAPDPVSHVVDNYFAGTLHFNYGLINRFVVGIQLPLVAAQGSNVTVPGSYNVPNDDGSGTLGLGYQGVGNIVLHGKARLLRPERNPIGLAAVLQISTPTGTSEQFAGEPGWALTPSLALEYRPIRRLRFATEFGFRLVTGEGATLNLEGTSQPRYALSQDVAEPASPPTGYDVTYDDQITFGAGFSARISEKVDLVAEGYGAQLASAIGEEGSLAIEAMGGFKVFVQDNSYLLLSGSYGIGEGFNTSDYRGVLGFIFEPSIGDRDGDGYKDDVDECPDDPEDFDGFEDEEGCPDPDNDRDGILDVDDECPNIPEDRDGDADQDGCPESADGDRDGDGIPDSIDECPDDPEDQDGFRDEDGCPDPDNDGDGILDVNDLCPLDAEDSDGFEDEDGCPDPDNDKDRILDNDDSCPNDPETYNGFEDEDGCPDRGSVMIEENQIVIMEKIYFETDSAEIMSRSFPIIDAVAATLVGNPNITLIEIQGHADERSSDEYNISLTRDRAAAVLEALARRGVEQERMRSAGYGERCPIDARSNATAWEKNRRVEFKIIKTEQGDTGVEVVCPAGASLTPG